MRRPSGRRRSAGPAERMAVEYVSRTIREVPFSFSAAIGQWALGNLLRLFGS